MALLLLAALASTASATCVMDQWMTKLHFEGSDDTGSLGYGDFLKIYQVPLLHDRYPLCGTNYEGSGSYQPDAYLYDSMMSSYLTSGSSSGSFSLGSLNGSYSLGSFSSDDGYGGDDYTDDGDDFFLESQTIECPLGNSTNPVSCLSLGRVYWGMLDVYFEFSGTGARLGIYDTVADEIVLDPVGGGATNAATTGQMVGAAVATGDSFTYSGSDADTQWVAFNMSSSIYELFLVSADDADFSSTVSFDWSVGEAYDPSCNAANAECSTTTWMYSAQDSYSSGVNNYVSICMGSDNTLDRAGPTSAVTVALNSEDTFGEVDPWVKFFDAYTGAELTTFDFATTDVTACRFVRITEYDDGEINTWSTVGSASDAEIAVTEISFVSSSADADWNGGTFYTQTKDRMDNVVTEFGAALPPGDSGTLAVTVDVVPGQTIEFAVSDQFSLSLSGSISGSYSFSAGSLGIDLSDLYFYVYDPWVYCGGLESVAECARRRRLSLSACDSDADGLWCPDSTGLVINIPATDPYYDPQGTYMMDMYNTGIYEIPFTLYVGAAVAEEEDVAAAEALAAAATAVVAGTVAGAVGGAVGSSVGAAAGGGVGGSVGGGAGGGVGGSAGGGAGGGGAGGGGGGSAGGGDVLSLLAQVQFMSLASALESPLPDSFRTFGSGFNWAKVQFGLPWDTTYLKECDTELKYEHYDDDGVLAENFYAEDTPQYIIDLGQTVEEFFVGNLFALVLATILLLIVHWLFIKALCRYMDRENYNIIAEQNRLSYLIHAKELNLPRTGFAARKNIWQGHYYRKTLEELGLPSLKKPWNMPGALDFGKFELAAALVAYMGVAQSSTAVMTGSNCGAGFVVLAVLVFLALPVGFALWVGHTLCLALHGKYPWQKEQQVDPVLEFESFDLADAFRKSVDVSDLENQSISDRKDLCMDLKKAALKSGRWVAMGQDGKAFKDRYSVIYEKWTATGGFYVFFDLCRKMVVAILLSAFATGELRQTQSVLFMLLMFFQCVYLIVAQPYVSRLANIKEFFTLAGQVATLMVAVIAEAVDEPDWDAAGTAMMVLALLGTAFSIAKEIAGMWDMLVVIPGKVWAFVGPVFGFAAAAKEAAEDVGVELVEVGAAAAATAGQAVDTVGDAAADAQAAVGDAAGDAADAAAAQAARIKAAIDQVVDPEVQASIRKMISDTISPIVAAYKATYQTCYGEWLMSIKPSERHVAVPPREEFHDEGKKAAAEAAGEVANAEDEEEGEEGEEEEPEEEEESSITLVDDEDHEPEETEVVDKKKKTTKTTGAAGATSATEAKAAEETKEEPAAEEEEEEEEEGDSATFLLIASTITPAMLKRGEAAIHPLIEAAINESPDLSSLPGLVEQACGIVDKIIEDNVAPIIASALEAAVHAMASSDAPEVEEGEGEGEGEGEASGEGEGEAEAEATAEPEAEAEAEAAAEPEAEAAAEPEAEAAAAAPEGEGEGEGEGSS